MRTPFSLAAILLSLSAVPAAANGRAHFSSRFCTSGSLTVCASVRVGTVSYTRADGTAGTHVTFSVANYSGWNPHATRRHGIIEMIHFHGAPPVHYPRPSFSVGFRGNAFGYQAPASSFQDFDIVAYSNWVEAGAWGVRFDNRSDPDYTGYFFGCDVYPGQGDSYLSTCAGGRVILSFDVPFEWSAAEITGVGLLANDPISWGADYCSTQWDGVVGGWENEGPCTVIPEPVTLLLFGTGLAGIGGVRMIRRRKKDERPPRARP